MDAEFAGAVDAVLLSELLGVLQDDYEDHTDLHDNFQFIGSVAESCPPQNGIEESELHGEDSGLLEALCAPLSTFDDGFLVEELNIHELSGLEEFDDKSAPVEEVTSREVSSDDQQVGKARATRRTSKSAPRKYNSNKAREEQRRELLSLRSRAVEMEQELEGMKAAAACGRTTLQALENRRHRLAQLKLLKSSAGGKETEGHVRLAEVWRQMCLQQLSRRIKSEQENARLKEAVARRMQVTCGIQAVLQTPLTSTNSPDELTSKRSRSPVMSSIDPNVDSEIFARLSSGVDAAVGKIDKFLEDKELKNVDTPRHGTEMREVDGGVMLDVFVTSVLPFDWEAASPGIWSFYNGFQKHFGAVHDKMTRRIDVGEDVVMESFVIEITAGAVTADFRVRQVIKRFMQEARLVILCQNDCQPIEYANQTTNFGFCETSFVICRPPRATPATGNGKPSGAMSVLQLGQWISPYMMTASQSGRQLSVRSNIDNISRFLFSSLHVEMRAKIDRIEDLLIDEHRRRLDRVALVSL